jgi:hypothetical protein
MLCWSLALADMRSLTGSGLDVTLAWKGPL